MKAGHHVSRYLLRSLAMVTWITLASIPAATPAGAKVRPVAGRPSAVVRLLQPLAGESVVQPTGWLEAAAPAGMTDLRIVVSRERFDASGWSDVPAGRNFFSGLPGQTHLALSAIPVPVGAGATLWWTAIAHDPRTGKLVAAASRPFVVVPGFANRVGAAPRLQPSATGMLPARVAMDPVHASRPIALGCGLTVTPGVIAPLPAGVADASPAAGPVGRRACLVQFADDAPDSARARIARAGGTVVAPISGSAWLVRMDAAARASLAAANGAPWIGDWRPEYKLSDLVAKAAPGPLSMTALLFDDGDEAANAAALAALGATQVKLHHGSVNHLVRFTLDAARAADAAALPDVAWLEPTARDAINNDQAQWATQTGTPNSRRLWDMGLRGRGQVVMTADSGIRSDHEMFIDTTLSITTWGDYPTHRKIIAYMPGSDDPSVKFGDDIGSDYHGTHTAGTVAGNPDATSGAPWSGMAKEAKLYFMDMAGPGSSGTLAPPADLNDLYRPSYTGNAGGAARLSSNSWGNSGSYGHYLLASMQVDQFMWTHPDYLVAFAAGNVGAFGTVQAPGTAKDCLTVGAVGNGTLSNTLAGFSSRGPTSDLRTKPEVMGPGDLVTSSIGSTAHMYATYSGTSMATPAVVGTLALMREYLVEGWYPTGAPVAANGFSPSAALLKAMAIGGARNDVQGYNAPNYTVGWGRLVADDVLYFPGDSVHTLLVDATSGMLDRQYTEYQVQVTDPNKPLKIALCWTDAPGNPASAVQLVNDLDLVVTHNGATYLGNYFLAGNSGVGGHRDSANVTEVVRVASPGTGLYTVRIEGHSVLQGPQPFGLCVTGGVNMGAGTVALDRFEYGLTDTLGIEVMDANATNPVTVMVHSPTEPNDERVTLTGGNGVFRGRLPIAPVVYRPVDGVLSVSAGDVITVTYNDGSPAMSVTASAPVNATPPVISEVHATASNSNSAIVTWTTNVPSTSSVFLGTGALTARTDSSGLTDTHAVLLTGLAAGTTYRYDVMSRSNTGALTADSLGGQHRQFTTPPRGQFALVMDDPSSHTAATWLNALARLGWTVDVIPRAQADPPLVGNASAGLRSYPVVMWQVDPDRYPAFSDAQRLAIDSLLTGGGRLLVTGHDIGYSLCDADVFSYTPERLAWFEGRLKTRFALDLQWADTLRGVPGDAATGAFAAGVKYHPELYPDAGDEVQFAPNNDVTGALDWFDDQPQPLSVGLRYETLASQGTPGSGIWGGKKSRYQGWYHEWSALSSTSSADAPPRTAVLENAVDWLLEHRPPRTAITLPAPGATVTGDYLAIRYSTPPDAGRAIVNRTLWYSLDGGESWTLLTTIAYGDSGFVWDLGASLGGSPVPNSARVLLKLRATDDGVPALADEYTMSGTFTLARAAGDTRGPVMVAGTVGTAPFPLKRGAPGTLSATVSDAETGAGIVSAAEYSIGVSPAPAGTGRAMAGTFGTTSVAVSVELNTSEFMTGTQAIWLRGRDGSGNWGPAAALTVTANDLGVLGVSEGLAVEFLAPPTPNPTNGPATLRFGLARGGDVRLDLFDLAGRRVRTLADGRLAAGPHVTTWDGRDEQLNRVPAGVYFVRLVTPTRTWQSRMVRLD
jgi:hypothetical protein